MPALEQAPESQAPRTATADRVPIASEEVAHKPFIPAEQDIPELTPVPLIVGTLLGILFGASSMYLVLKVGLTVSASIPVAVLSITIFRGFTRVFRTRRATILENNITQTAGSAGESIAFGVGVTMPALLILGYNLQISQVILVSILGGLLGILMMIPLRRALIVKEAKTLVYPEGTACAEVLISGETGGTTAKTVFAGLGVGGVFALGYKAFGAFKDLRRRQPIARSGAGVDGSRLHHRDSHRDDHGRRRHPLQPGADAGHQALRQHSHDADLSGHDADQEHEHRRCLASVYSVYWSWRGRRRRHHLAVQVAADDRGRCHARHALVERLAGTFGNAADRPGHPPLGGRRRLAADRDRLRARPLLQDQRPRGGAHPGARVPLRDRQLTLDGRGRKLVESHLRDDRRHPVDHVADLLRPRLGHSSLQGRRPQHRRGGLHRHLQRRHHLAGLEDRISGRRDPVASADRHPGGRLGIRVGAWIRDSQAQRRRNGVRGAELPERALQRGGLQRREGAPARRRLRARRQRLQRDLAARATGRGARREVPRRRHRAHQVSRGSRHQRKARHARQRRKGEVEVQRAEAGAHVLHHRGDHDPASALGAGADRRLRLRGPGALRDVEPRFRRRRLPAAVDEHPHHDGRHRPVHRRPDREPKAERSRGGERSRRAVRLRADRGRQRHRHHPRVPAAL
ncbi:MAG: hypothetical protein E6J58_01655 [Deltaproteobacteria bacterium]|nr:MAG: hypothetical protein E6J58_01655 [Deltaproteobacteria bacterium]